LEELLIRRELAINVVHYQSDNDNLNCVPSWSAKTLQEHLEDRCEYVYSLEELEGCQSHDRVWNAAMLEMKHMGYLYNRLRMYWVKKIVKWLGSPSGAHQTICT
jgi:deoxyribodipyrimidine photo-lyase